MSKLDDNIKQNGFKDFDEWADLIQLAKKNADPNLDPFDPEVHRKLKLFNNWLHDDGTKDGLKETGLID